MAGMTVGVYTGGTPNMSAIGLALEVTDEKFVLVNGADVVLSAVYLLFLMTIAQRVLLKFLPAFQRTGTGDEPHTSGMEAYPVQVLKPRPKDVAAAIGLSALIAGLTIGPRQSSTVRPDRPCHPQRQNARHCPVLCAWIRSRPAHTRLEQYLLLIFAVAIGTLATSAKWPKPSQRYSCS